MPTAWIVEAVDIFKERHPQTRDFAVEEQISAARRISSPEANQTRSHTHFPGTEHLDDHQH